MIRPEIGYTELHNVLMEALCQAQYGKGKERHACGKPFLKQPMMEIGRMVGPGYMIGQAMKKAQESMRLPLHAAVAECFGAINYLAGAVLLLREHAEATTYGGATTNETGTNNPGAVCSGDNQRSIGGRREANVD